MSNDENQVQTEVVEETVEVAKDEPTMITVEDAVDAEDQPNR